VIYTGFASLLIDRLIPLQPPPACKDGGLHGADLPHHTIAWPKHCRSRPDLSDLSKFQDYPEPRQQIGGNMHRLSRGFTDRDMKMEERPNRRLDLEDCLQPDHMNNTICRMDIIHHHKVEGR